MTTHGGTRDRARGSGGRQRGRVSGRRSGRQAARPSAVLAAAALAVGMVTVAPPASACACGAIVDGPAWETTVTSETAVLQWDGTTQTVLLELEALSSAPDVGLVLPTPAPATVELADPEVFRELERVTEPQPVVTEYRWWPELGLGEAGAGGAPGVEVLDEVRLGPLDVTTLGATDPAALDAWLVEHGYQLPSAFAAALEPYVTEGWSFVAARVAPEQADRLSGTLQPLRVTFASSALVYPMRLSAAADQPQTTRTYVLGEHRVDRIDPIAQQDEPDVRFAGRVPPDSVQSPELAELLRAGDFVTAHDQSFVDPGTQIVSDFAFAPAATDAAVTRSYAAVADKRIGPFFAGPVLAFGGLLGLASLLVWAAAHRRHRRHRRRAPARSGASRPVRA